jgi:hypothetical protein
MASPYLLESLLRVLKLRTRALRPGLLPKSRSQPNDNDWVCRPSRCIACRAQFLLAALLRTTRYTVQCSNLRADTIVEV